MKWQDILIREAERIVEHRKGHMEFDCKDRDDYLTVQIEAGRRWEFKVSVKARIIDD